MHRHGFFIDLLNKVLPKKLYMCNAVYFTTERSHFLSIVYKVDYLGCDLICLRYLLEDHAKKQNPGYDIELLFMGVIRITQKENDELKKIDIERERLKKLKELKPSET